MNQTLETIMSRKSVRAYLDKPVPPEVREQVLQATLRAPTAGNLMLYSVIEVTDQAVKDRLAVTCDNQPFITRAPWVLLFLADYQRWFDYFELCGVKEFAARKNLPRRKPAEGDLMLACCDALIAAQTAVVAAESVGLGSCYIGDIMENCEAHRSMFNLPPYTFPIALLCFGYPTDAEKTRKPPSRFDRRHIIFENRYRRLDETEFTQMFQAETERVFSKQKEVLGAVNVGQMTYKRKVAAGFALELNRSVQSIMKNWDGE
jgi:nitroreductase